MRHRKSNLILDVLVVVRNNKEDSKVIDYLQCTGPAAKQQYERVIQRRNTWFKRIKSIICVI